MENSAVSNPLHTISNMGDLKAILEQDASSINELDHDGYAPLHRVLNDPECSVDIVTLLLYYGANVNLVNKYLRSPLYLALYNCKKEVVELLLGKGAVMEKTWQTSLHVVLGMRRNNQKDTKYILKLLLDKGTDVNVPTDAVFNTIDFGQTPLCIALHRHKVDIIKMLLDAGARMSACKCHVSPFHCYMDNWDHHAHHCYLDNCDRQVSKFHWDLSNNFDSLKEVNVLKLLLNIGTDLNVVDTKGETPLCHALRRHKIDVIELLLDADANVNRCENHISSFHCYVNTLNNIEMNVLKLLMAKGDDINKVNEKGQTPLCIAFDEHKVDSIKHLLNAGADMNGCKRHTSPVHCYVTQSCFLKVDMIQLFVDAGVDIHKVDDDGNTPLLLALKICDCEISAIKLLLDHKGRGINVRNKSGESLLHCALQNEFCMKLSVIKLLILRGAPIDSVTESGDIPLHDALKNRRCGPNIIKTLLNKGSSVNLVNKLGRTPLGNVKFAKCNHGVLKLLLAAGARIKGANGYQELSILQQVIKVYDLKKCKKNLQCFKMFFKYYFLENPDLDIEGLIQGHKDYNTLSNFAKMCGQELQEMETETVGPDFTLREFLGIQMDSGEFKQKGKDYDFDQLFKILAKNKCPVYLEVVLARVGRSCMIDKLKEMPIYTKISSPDFPCVKSKIILDHPFACHIAQYLSDNDLLNVILAFHKSSNSPAFGHSKNKYLVG